MIRTVSSGAVLVLRALPDELFQAARVDGCTHWQAFVHVFLPLAAPSLAVAAILVFVFSWNERVGADGGSDQGMIAGRESFARPAGSDLP